jgi:hypothetical protein
LGQVDRGLSPTTLRRASTCQSKPPPILPCPALPVSKRRRISDSQVADICDSVAQRHRQALLASSLECLDNHEPSYWLRTTVREIGERVLAGRVEFCAHLGVGSSVYMAAWRPDLAMCRECSPQLWDGLRGTSDDARCDRCGQVVADGRINGGLLVLGAVLLTFGLCDECAAREGTLA